MSYRNYLPTAVKNLEAGLAHLAETFKGQVEEPGSLLQDGARFGVGVEGIIWYRVRGLEKRRTLDLDLL